MNGMSPPALLVVLRGAHDAALLSAFGALLFPWVMGADAALARRSVRLGGWSALLALGLGAVWFVAEAASVADAEGLPQALKAVPEFVTYLAFGRLLLARLVLLGGALLLLAGRGSRPVLALVGAALGLQPLLAHAGAMFGVRGNVLIGAEIVHVLAAGAWLGGLIPLLLGLLAAPGRAAALLRRFSRLGVAAVLAIVMTGVVQLGLLTGGFGGLIGSEYGEAIALKLLFFAAALVFAAFNRFVLTDRIGAAFPPGMRRVLEGSLTGEAAFGVCVVLAAGWLASLAPG